MTAPASHASEIAAKLSQGKTRLIERWTRRVLEDPEVPLAERLEWPTLIDHVPELIDHLVEALTRRARETGAGAHDARSASEPDHHGQQFATLRVGAGYSIAEALRELSHLRSTIIELYFELPDRADCGEEQFAHEFLDKAMWAAAVEMDTRMRTEREASADRLRLAAEASGVGVWDYCPGTGAVRWDDRCRAFFELPPEVEVTSERFLAWVHPDDREPTRSAVARALAPASGGAYQNEFRIRSARDGRERWIKANGRASFDEAGRAVRVIGTARDITEQKRAEAEKVEQITLRDRFMGVLSHDLRNPVFAITLGATLLLRLGNLSPSQILALQRINLSATRVARMIDDLLDVTRSKGGALPIEPVPSDLHVICQNAIDELEGVRPSTPIVLEAHGDTEGVWDPYRLAQLVSNLVSNALDFSAQGTSVRVVVRGEERALVLEVHNEGPVIPARLIPAIFEPFRQGPAEGRIRRRSLGLGLFIARLIAEAHGGSIAVTSTPDQGTTFAVRLPRRPPGAETEP